MRPYRQNSTGCVKSFYCIPLGYSWSLKCGCFTISELLPLLLMHAELQDRINEGQLKHIYDSNCVPEVLHTEMYIQDSECH